MLESVYPHLLSPNIISLQLIGGRILGGLKERRLPAPARAPLRGHSGRRLGDHGDLGLPRERRAHDETLIRQLDPLRLLVVPGTARGCCCSSAAALVVVGGTPYKSRSANTYVINKGQSSKYVLQDEMLQKPFRGNFRFQEHVLPIRLSSIVVFIVLIPQT